MVTKDDLAKLKVIGHDGKEQPLVLRDCQVAFLNKLLEAKNLSYNYIIKVDHETERRIY